MTTSVSVPMHVPKPVAEAPVTAERGAPCTMVIFGASGDLARRKLIPALFHLMGDGLLDERFSVIGIGRHSMSDDDFRAAMRDALPRHPGAGAADWEAFAPRLQYLGGDLASAATYAQLGQRLATLELDAAGADREPRGRLFYLALPPSVYETAITHLSDSGLAPRTDPDQRPWARLIIEKPFGRDLDSARALNGLLRARFGEHQLFRIDHYLGKETVQNLLVFRFANSVFEPIWNRNHIHHVQITAAEQVGVEHRGGYYEESGVIRDMFQNHLIQLLTLTAMEPPVAFRADAVRSEKVKVMNAIRAGDPGESSCAAVWGQYGAGVIDGKPVPGYRDEPGIDPRSTTPTFGALRLFVDNWRWQGVPFFLRSGKRLPHRVTEIAIQFRNPPHLMFPRNGRSQISSNTLAFRIQPDEGISLCFEIKVPDHDLRIETADMHFSYAGEFGPSMHSAYETLLVDCMVGDATLFTRSDAVEAAWRVVDPLLAMLESTPARFPNYSAGEWGPAAADALIAADGAAWRTP